MLHYIYTPFIVTVFKCFTAFIHLSLLLLFSNASLYLYEIVTKVVIQCTTSIKLIINMFILNVFDVCFAGLFVF